MFPTADQFAAAIGDAFEVTAGENGSPTEPVALTLSKLTPLQSAMPEREAFMLTFGQSGQDVLPQAIYRFAHPAMGTHDIFIVPVARDAEGVIYEAVFT